MMHKRINKVTISGNNKNPGMNNGNDIYEYTENGFLYSCSRFCNEAEKPWSEKPWWVKKYINNDFGLPIRNECFLMGEYVRYDTYEYKDDKKMKWSVYDLKRGLSSYFEIDYENGKEVERRSYSYKGELRQCFYVKYDHLGRKSKIISKDLDGTINTESIYEYDNDLLLARIDYVRGFDSEYEREIIRNQFSWEEKSCSANLLSWFMSQVI